MKDLIYLVGETLFLELDGVVDIAYPAGVQTPNELTMITVQGDYKLSLKKVS